MPLGELIRNDGVACSSHASGTTHYPPSSVLLLAEELDISKAAAARRYVELHRDTLAVVFSQHDRFLYAYRGPAFPWIPFDRQQSLPELPATAEGASLHR